MSTCHCGGNNSLRSALGGMRCECGGLLNQAQINVRVASRLVEIEEDQFKMIGALQRLGADRCDHCGNWDVKTWGLFDHCSCLKCLADDPEWPLNDESLTEEQCAEMANSIVHFLQGKGRTPPKYHGQLLEAYQRFCRVAA